MQNVQNVHAFLRRKHGNAGLALSLGSLTRILVARIFKFDDDFEWDAARA